MKFNKYNSFIAGLLLLAACRPDVATPTVSNGTADFSTYIAIGDSQSAGYADNGLYREGQLNSFPAIIAQQMKAVGGGTFNQPLFSEAQANGSGYLKLAGFNANGTPRLDTVKTNLARRGILAVPNFGNVILYTKYTGDNSNFGIPGIKLQQIAYAPYSNLNGYYERLLPGNSPNNTTTYLDYVSSKPHTFFSCWLGNNDALTYATNGGASDALTDKTDFAQLYSVLIDRLTSKGQKGVIATIPDVSAIPFFNTFTVSAILAGVKAQNPAVQNLYINAKTVASVSSTAHAPRAATAKDLLVLTFPTALIGRPTTNAAGTFPYGLDPRAPIEDKYVLDETEVSLVRDYVNSYNVTIKSIATMKDLALFDAYTYLNQVIKGITINGVNLNTAYITGGLFSLDGVHFTPRGYAIEANEFIKVINFKYSSTIPSVNVTDYSGIKFP